MREFITYNGTLHGTLCRGTDIYFWRYLNDRAEKRSEERCTYGRFRKRVLRSRMLTLFLSFPCNRLVCKCRAIYLGRCACEKTKFSRSNALSAVHFVNFAKHRCGSPASNPMSPITTNVTLNVRCAPTSR